MNQTMNRTARVMQWVAATAAAGAFLVFAITGPLWVAAAWAVAATLFTWRGMTGK